MIGVRLCKGCGVPQTEEEARDVCGTCGYDPGMKARQRRHERRAAERRAARERDGQA